MNAMSPFAVSRFEYEQEHLYFLPKQLILELESPSPTYLVGSRGTGKTTLLKALTSVERVRNQSLRQQLGDNPFSGKYIGVYFKLPGIQLQLIDEWMLKSTEQVHGWCIGLFLDLVWIELAINAISELIAEGVFTISPADEHHCIDGIIHEHQKVLHRHLPIRGPYTLSALGDAIKSMRRTIESTAIRRGEWLDALHDYPTGQIGSFGRRMGAMLAPLCNGNSKTDQNRWRFMVCMDEGECMTPFQQRVVNTLVRLSEWPVFPVVAFVSLPEETTRTLVPNITLQKADRKLHMLDNMNDREFKDLAEGVATIRVQTELNDLNASFSTEKVFGVLDLNALLSEILQESVQPKAKTLLKKASELSNLPFLKEPGYNLNPEEDRNLCLPIYQAYLVEQLKLVIPSPSHESWQRRRQDSAEIRKRMVAAYLTICHELKTKVRYASGEMILQMSDKCMRDFLSQTQEVFRSSGKTLGDFLNGTVSISAQDAALRRASISKKESLPLSGVPAPTQTARIVDGIARITAIVQSQGKDNQHLRSSERGIFEIKVDDLDKQHFANETKSLTDAAEAGFLKLISNEGSIWLFRVHASLAAAYGFSYRGAYYKIRINLADIRKLSQARDADQLTAIIDSISDTLIGQEDDDMPLFKQLLL